MEIEEQIEEVRKTFSINADLADLLEREAYWNRKSLKILLEEILANHYEDKDIPNFPVGYKKAQVGRKSKRPA